MKTSIKLLALVPFMGIAISAQANTAESTSYPQSTPTTSSSASDPSVLDQSSGTNQDVAVTRMIREELGKNDKLSTSAKNIEVITLNNTVTLRGTVSSQAEKQQVTSLAQNAAGNRSIRNEITVDTTAR